MAPAAGRSGPASLPACRKKASTSRCTIVRHQFWLDVGRIHADTVSAAPTFSDADAGTRTVLLIPLKLSALPKRPSVDQTAPLIVPVLPRPDASAVVVAPNPSLNPQAPTNPTGSGGVEAVVAGATPEYGPRLPAVSAARTR